jgi:hypothetical protein
MANKWYPDSRELIICADGGGSNGSRNRGWKVHLQERVNQIDTSITVWYPPPGRSKWKKIEHRMFSFISMNWKGKLLINYETVIKPISSTETKNGLKVVVRGDKNKHHTGVKVSDEGYGEFTFRYTFITPKMELYIAARW